MKPSTDTAMDYADAEEYEEYKLSIMESKYDRGTETLVEAIDETDS